MLKGYGKLIEYTYLRAHGNISCRMMPRDYPGRRRNLMMGRWILMMVQKPTLVENLCHLAMDSNSKDDGLTLSYVANSSEES